MPSLLIGLLVALAGWGQITQPPEFQDKGTFQRGASGATVDGTSHVAPQRAEVNRELVARLRSVPELAEGTRLIEQGMLGAAGEQFRTKGLRLGQAAVLFLEGKVDESANLLCALAKEQPNNKTLLPFFGLTVGASKASLGPMLESVRALASPPTAEGEYYLARALLQQDPPATAEALIHLRKSTELDTTGTHALLELGRQHTLAGETSAAIQVLQEALRRDDTLAVAHYRLSQLYRSSRQMEPSRQHLRRYQQLRSRKE